MDRCGVFNGAEMSRFRHVRASALLISHRAWHRYRYREQNAKSISTPSRDRNEIPRYVPTDVSDTLNVVMKNCLYNPEEYSRWNSVHSISNRLAGVRGNTRSTFEDVYEIFNGLCECLWFSFSSPEYTPSTCGYLQFLKKNAARSMIREMNSNLV